MINTTHINHSRHDGASGRITTFPRQKVYQDLEPKTGSPASTIVELRLRLEKARHLDHAKVSKERVSQRANNSSVPTRQAEQLKPTPTDL